LSDLVITRKKRNIVSGLRGCAPGGWGRVHETGMGKLANKRGWLKRGWNRSAREKNSLDHEGKFQVPYVTEVGGGGISPEGGSIKRKVTKGMCHNTARGKSRSKDVS